MTKDDDSPERCRSLDVAGADRPEQTRTSACCCAHGKACAARRSTRRRDRDHRGPRRTVRVLLRLTEEQALAMEEAARSAGLTLSGYAADAAVAAAAGSPPPPSEPLRAALGDLIDARAQLRRVGTNVHLAVKALHRTGEPPSWLRAAVEDTAAAVARVDEAAQAITRHLR